MDALVAFLFLPIRSQYNKTYRIGMDLIARSILEALMNECQLTAQDTTNFDADDEWGKGKECFTIEEIQTRR
ncbi:hypothetical protein MKX68_00360 [Paenibacillus sp. FSL M8-0212]|uniref:hypothetical protein n=1 Tax=Paenibacillus sp. FSL M8-0212 TaxID=2921618 RepID=UPI0030F80AA8